MAVAGTTLTLGLVSSSSGGKFYSNNTCTGGNQISSVTISSGGSAATFYYKDTLAGNPLVTVTEAPGISGLTDGTQTETITQVAGTATTLTLQGPTAVAAGVCSPALSIVALDSSATEVNVSSTINITLTAGGKAGFFSDSGCSTSITTTTITSGSSRRTIYYKNNAGGGQHRICRYRKASTAILNSTLGGAALQICAETDDL